VKCIGIEVDFLPTVSYLWTQEDEDMLSKPIALGPTKGRKTYQRLTLLTIHEPDR
jgi:hypothetical protein